MSYAAIKAKQQEEVNAFPFMLMIENVKRDHKLRARFLEISGL